MRRENLGTRRGGGTELRQTPAGTSAAAIETSRTKIVIIGRTGETETDRTGIVEGTEKGVRPGTTERRIGTGRNDRLGTTRRRIERAPGHDPRIAFYLNRSEL